MRNVIAAGVTAVVLAACGGADPGGTADAGGPRDEARGSGRATSSTTTSSAGCVEAYTPDGLAGRAFAFDGTITAIEMRTDPKAPAEEGEIPLATFEVHEWYRGGSAATVHVWMQGASAETSVGSLEVEVGSRLLVSGEPRWGGEPLDDAIAWPCGFTQPWSEAAAAEWEAATS